MRLRDAFHAHVRSIKSAPRVTPPCVFAEPRGIAKFGSETVALFPEVCSDISRLAAGRPLTEPSRGLHTICSTFHQIGIRSFFCSLQIADASDPASFRWQALRLGTPADEAWQPLDAALTPYLQARTRAYNYLRYNTDTSRIPDSCITEEFLKEHLRVSVCTPFTAEVSDVDGILWGNERTYPLEIKEKTAAFDNKLGEYFGIDVGPFVKLAFYAAKRGNLHSLFVVREITDTETRALKQWWFIPFDRLASYASWNQQGGGTNMLGGSSTVVRIPKSQFSILSRDALNQL
ncbi:MAG TPA: hypothetical protein VFN09_08175 [Rhodanobacteraceae bacterium]|nr:hypothetical protein [Rhodanobacteraceae bacterium]